MPIFPSSMTLNTSTLRNRASLDFLGRDFNVYRWKPVNQAWCLEEKTKLCMYVCVYIYIYIWLLCLLEIQLQNNKNSITCYWNCLTIHKKYIFISFCVQKDTTRHGMSINNFPVSSHTLKLCRLIREIK